MLSEIGRERLTESYKAQAQHPKFEAYAKDNTLRKSNPVESVPPAPVLAKTVSDTAGTQQQDQTREKE